ncbi:MAG: GNAT family N-acetyltransferase [Bacteroidales bacterium]|nr:GNAT family N-acetyltransferase [Bacteroidales bacterium]
MSCKVLSLKERAEWGAYLSQLPSSQQDVYYTPEYYELYERNGAGKSKCFVFELEGEIAIYPFLINSVNTLGYKLREEYFDIQGAYGYNGVVFSTHKKDFRQEFYDAFNSFCQKENIIAEFTRFHPLFQNHEFPIDSKILQVNKNVILDLSIDDYWTNSYEHSTRKNINKALRNGLEVVHYSGSEINKERIAEFEDIYQSTMSRNSADEFYYFDSAFFGSLAKGLGDKAQFFFTYMHDKIISCELVVCGSEVGYSFLGGTLSEYYGYRPNDILKHKIIEVLKNLSYKYFCLGGGIKPDDGIFNYKKKFAKNGVYDFFIGKKIHNLKIYQEVVTQWREKHADLYNEFSDILLCYRNTAG